MCKKEHLITILTPTYNREVELQKLYESLKNQTVKDFFWFVVDDGSTDNTEKYIDEILRENKLEIEYIKKQNGGKHTALNEGISRVKTELTFIVDSDDFLPCTAIETIMRYHEKYRDLHGLCGYSFLRVYPDGSVNEAFYSENEKIDTYVNARINAGIGGDKAEVFFTDILKKYPFPVFEKEHFLPEDLVWVKMSGPYKMVHINECVYISDYLEGGLTKSGRKLKLKSPIGMTARSVVYLEDNTVNFKTKCKMSLLYQIYANQCGKNQAVKVKNWKGKIMLSLFFIPGIVCSWIWKNKYK